MEANRLVSERSTVETRWFRLCSVSNAIVPDLEYCSRRMWMLVIPTILELCDRIMVSHER